MFLSSSTFEMVDSQCFCVMYILSDTVCIVPSAVGGAQFRFTTENARVSETQRDEPRALLFPYIFHCWE